MSIRIATEQDVLPLAKLVAALAHYYLEDSSDVLPAWFSETLSVSAFSARIASAEYLNFLFEEAGVIAGYISIKGGAHLYHLFVAEEFHGRGIGRALWMHAKGRIQSNTVSLRSSIYAVPIYKKFGFYESGAVGIKDGISFQPMVFEK